MKIPLYSQDGSKTGELAVPENIFGTKPQQHLIHKMLVRQLANGRHPIAHALTKGEVRGGGKKPYRQKHTGNARQGSTRNPHFRGGGVAFGPRNVRNFVTRMSQKERRLALFSTLAAKYNDGLVSALEGFTSEKKKTKDFALMMKKLPFKKDVLFVMPQKDEIAARTSKNIPHVKTILVNYLNLADLLKFHDVVFFKEAVSQLEIIFHSK